MKRGTSKVLWFEIQEQILDQSLQIHSLAFVWVFLSSGTSEDLSSGSTKPLETYSCSKSKPRFHSSGPLFISFRNCRANPYWNILCLPRRFEHNFFHQRFRAVSVCFFASHSISSVPPLFSLRNFRAVTQPFLQLLCLRTALSTTVVTEQLVLPDTSESFYLRRKRATFFVQTHRSSFNRYFLVLWLFKFIWTVWVVLQVFFRYFRASYLF